MQKIDTSPIFSPLSEPALTAQVRQDVQRALDEDVGRGDLTAGLIDPGCRMQARILAREPAVLCGVAWVREAVLALDPNAVLDWQVQEGGRCVENEVVLTVQGQARALLTAERTALNFLQMMSAVATQTAACVAALQGLPTQVVDTRKTLPGLRLAQKYAVHVGGGVNHRMGLYDAVLIKENHIAAAGGIAQVMASAQRIAAQAQFVQIEVETLDQLQQALQAGATMVLLDNMDLPMLRQAVDINQGRATLEVSGGVTLENLRRVAQTGVHRISMGHLTKDVKAIDFSMRFQML